jgi:hypothetical protein
LCSLIFGVSGSGKSHAGSKGEQCGEFDHGPSCTD